MALNINVQVKVDDEHFNASTSTKIRNDIALGDPGPNDRATGLDDLQGDLASFGPDDGVGRAMRGTQLHDLNGGSERGEWPRAHSTHPHGSAPGAPARHAHSPAGLAPVSHAPHHHAHGGYTPRPASPARANHTPRPAMPAHHVPGAYTPRPPHGSAPRTGSAETDRAIREAAREGGIDVNTMRAIASIESGMNPGSNRNNRHTQYKGLYQIGHNEWATFGRGDIYNAHDNAMAAARMLRAHRAAFRARFGRDPTDRELYMIHQQGLGFYTRGIMTNIRGNAYPHMRGRQTQQSFEAGWGRELERRAAFFRARERAAQAASSSAPAAPAAGR